jgi:hypothetical protein
MYQEDGENITILSVTTKRNCILITRINSFVYKCKKKVKFVSLCTFSARRRTITFQSLAQRQRESITAFGFTKSPALYWNASRLYFPSEQLSKLSDHNCTRRYLKVLWTLRNYFRTILSLEFLSISTFRAWCAQTPAPGTLVKLCAQSADSWTPLATTKYLPAGALMTTIQLNITNRHDTPLLYFFPPSCRNRPAATTSNYPQGA